MQLHPGVERYYREFGALKCPALTLRGCLSDSLRAEVQSLRSLCPAHCAEKHLGKIAPELGPFFLKKYAILL